MVPASLPAEVATAVANTKGFMPQDEGEALHAHALRSSPGTWLEIGTYCGKSTLILADAARRSGSSLVTVDHHHGSEENQPGWEWHDTAMVDPVSGRLDTLPTFRPVLDSVADVCSAVVGSTQQVASWWASPLTLLFLDGNHTEETAQHDYAAFAPFVVPGGTLLVHDVFPDPADGGQAPWHVVQRAFSEGFVEIAQHGSLRVLRRT
ncbi:methyltransferase family protein [Branchiibius hedensis]|uniref:Methyltransferase domain-containing protein n=1 Tax=Branchiibius hedensis TaxID=672460 RepID=A0A2Y8ZWN4_9MICO|nr:class I SAM-dependent methyltransferase [Branchiibius hedensis]PWJ26897.1 methyltransferase family protein [Branchiibius hedensis]SSA35708.1 Methyltransferase domain-containing protein [Branchiibius hedensis]